MQISSKQRAISPVVAQIVLAAAVLTIGEFVWHFAFSYSSTTSDDYIEEN
jgi:hypothetical protein